MEPRKKNQGKKIKTRTERERERERGGIIYICLFIYITFFFNQRNELSFLAREFF